MLKPVSEPALPQMSNRAWIMVVAGAVVVTLSMGVRQAFGLFLTPLGLDLNLSREAFGLAIAIQNLLFGLIQPFVGAWADRHGAGLRSRSARPTLPPGRLTSGCPPAGCHQPFTRSHTAITSGPPSTT